MLNLIETNYTYESDDDGFIYGTFHTKFSFRDGEQKFDTLFRKREAFQNNDFERAKIIVFSEISKLENITFHPVLLSQLILIMAGAELVFHRDKRDRHPEAKFHTAGLHFEKVLRVFGNLLKNKNDGLKLATQFKHEPLKGIWYIHVPDASISGIAENIRQENKRNGWLKQRCEEEFGLYDASKIDDKNLNEFIVDQMIFKGQEKRHADNRMTGEWLVFQKREKEIHLLTLASHKESDERILARIKGNLPPTASPIQ